MAWKPFKKLRDYIPVEFRKEYDDLVSGSTSFYNMGLLLTIEEAKKQYNKEHIFKI